MSREARQPEEGIPAALSVGRERRSLGADQPGPGRRPGRNTHGALCKARRRPPAIRAASLAAFVALAGACLAACGSIAEPMSSSSGSGVGGDASSRTASTSGTSTSAS